ncbi:MAG TPA: hypothetical protein EYM64_03980 [Phycisphaerales bacterium]|nr:hypothetical protein [Phycisphaerales bacterium]
MKINKDTNVDSLTRREIGIEARRSKNRARVKLLCHIHKTIDETSMETAYGYDPINDLSFTGEFEAIGA